MDKRMLWLFNVTQNIERWSFSRDVTVKMQSNMESFSEICFPFVLIFLSSFRDIAAEKDNIYIADDQFSRSLYTWEIMESNTSFKHIHALPNNTTITAISVTGSHFILNSSTWIELNHTQDGLAEPISSLNVELNVVLFTTESGNAYVIGNTQGAPLILGTTTDSSIKLIVKSNGYGANTTLEILATGTLTLNTTLAVSVTRINATDVSCTTWSNSCWFLEGSRMVKYFQWNTPLHNLTVLKTLSIPGYDFVSVSAHSNEVWLVTHDGKWAWRRLGVSLQNPAGDSWMILPLHLPLPVLKVSVGAAGIFALMQGGMAAKFQGFELAATNAPLNLFQIDTYDDKSVMGIEERGTWVQSVLPNATATSFGVLMMYEKGQKTWAPVPGFENMTIKKMAVGETQTFVLRRGINSYVSTVDIQAQVFIKYGTLLISTLELGAGADGVLYLIEDGNVHAHLRCENSSGSFIIVGNPNVSTFRNFGSISCGKTHCWGIKSNGTSAYISLDQSLLCSENISTNQLRLFSEDLVLKTLDTDKTGKTWAVEAGTNDVFVRLGVDNSTLEGTMWANMPGVNFKDVAVGRNVVYGIDMSGYFVSFGIKDGNWTSWSQWSSCSTDCGGGSQHRVRYCNRPAPVYGGLNCTGKGLETRPCNEQNCTGFSWSSWSVWTSCHGNCPVGESTRIRSCVEAPLDTAANCTGNNKETMACLNQCSNSVTGLVERSIMEPWQDVRKGLFCLPYNSFMTISPSMKVMMLYFENVTIPRGAQIIDAYVQFTCKTSYSSGHTVEVGGVLNAESIITEDYLVCNFTSLQYTSHVVWTAGNWNLDDRGPEQQASNLSSIIQQVISDARWNGTGPIIIHFQNVTNGLRAVYSYDDDPVKAATLSVTFSETYAVPLNTNWTAWSPWTSCSHSCFTGKRHRTKQCRIVGENMTLPSSYCVAGPSYEEQFCNTHSCYDLPNCTIAINGNGTISCCMLGMQLKDLSYLDECYIQSISSSYHCPLDRYSNSTGTCLPIDGGFSDWTDWSACSRECFTGHRSRNRSCSNPPPKYNGLNCVEDSHESETCNTQPCFDLSTCTQAMDSNRNLTCCMDSCIFMEDAGHQCNISSLSENGTCVPIDGGFSDWTDWSACSRECFTGHRIRNRSCSNPQPKYNGLNCVGDSHESETCNTQPCFDLSNCTQAIDSNGNLTCCMDSCIFMEDAGYQCNISSLSENGTCVPIDGGFSDWTDWSACSRECFTGHRSRNRSCSNPPPKYNGLNCVGDSHESETCNTQPCFDLSNCTHATDSNGNLTCCMDSCIFIEDAGYQCNISSLNENGTCVPIDGRWAKWSKWTSCSTAMLCRVQTRIRSRSCVSPSYGGEYCTGEANQSDGCMGKCIEDGVWSGWSLFEPCNVTCGTGYQTWTRTCLRMDHPDTLPLIACNGTNIKTNSCVSHDCVTSNPSSLLPETSKKTNDIPTTLLPSPSATGLETALFSIESADVNATVELKASNVSQLWNTLSSAEPNSAPNSVAFDSERPNWAEISVTTQMSLDPSFATTRSVDLGSLESSTDVNVVDSFVNVATEDKLAPSSSLIEETSSQFREDKRPLSSEKKSSLSSPISSAPVLLTTVVLSQLTGPTVSLFTWESETIRSSAVQTAMNNQFSSRNPASSITQETSVTFIYGKQIDSSIQPQSDGSVTWLSKMQPRRSVGDLSTSENVGLTSSVDIAQVIEFTTSSQLASSKTKHSVSIGPGYSEWSYWGECSKSCGKGVRTRFRECVTAINCKDPVSQESICENVPCPINGGWTDWSPWTPCNRQCDGGERTSYRSCINPPPQHGGLQCDGSSSMKLECNLHICPVDGGWSAWTQWSRCDKPCNNGYRRRIRFCNAPSPLYGGKECLGEKEDKRICNTNSCKDIKVNVTARLREEIFSNELFTRSSSQFQRLESDILNNLKSIYRNSSIVLYLKLLRCRPGSVIATFTIGYKEVSTVELVVLATYLDEKKLLGAMPVGFSSINATDVPPAPQSPIAETISESSIRLRWKSFATILSEYKSNLTGYIITYKKTADYNVEVWERIAVSSNDSSIEVMYLSPFVLYTFRVTAMTNTGLGIPSEFVDAYTMQAAPSRPPTDFECQAVLSTEIFCEWKDIPRDHQNGEMLSYVVKYRMYSRFNSNATKTWFNVTIPATQNQYILNDLKVSTRYELEINAATIAGNGPVTWTQVKTNDGVPTLSPMNITVSNFASENFIDIYWESIPSEFWNGKPLGINLYYKLRRNGSAVILSGKYKEISLGFDESHHQITGLQVNWAISFYLVGLTSAGEGSQSAHVIGETCRCTQNIYAAWFEKSPYVTAGSDAFTGIFPKLISDIVKDVCGYCKAYGYAKVFCDRSKSGRNPKRESEVELRSKVNDDVHFHLPVTGSKALTLVEGKYQYVQIIDDTGSVFVGVDQNSAPKSKKILSVLVYMYPIVLVMTSLIVTAGILIWFADQSTNPDELQKGHFFKGVLNGAWWAFITMTTVGYGDIAPKSCFGRIISVAWIVIGLILTSVFISTLTTSIIVASVNSDIKLYGTKVAALRNSPEYWLGLRRLARMNTADTKGKNFTTSKEVLQSVISGQAKGALLEANEASTLLDFISENGLRIIKQIDSTKGVGILLTAEMAEVHLDIRTYVRNNHDVIKSLLKNGTQALEVEAPSQRSNTRKQIFSSNSPLFKESLKFSLIIYGSLFAFGFLWQFFLRSGIAKLKRIYPKTREERIKERYFKGSDELSEMVETFVTKHRKEIEDMFENQMRERFQLVLKHSNTTPFGPRGWIRYKTLNMRQILSEIKAEEIINENLMYRRRKPKVGPRPRPVDIMEMNVDIEPILEPTGFEESKE